MVGFVHTKLEVVTGGPDGKVLGWNVQVGRERPERRMDSGAGAGEGHCQRRPSPLKAAIV